MAARAEEGPQGVWRNVSQTESYQSISRQPTGRFDDLFALSWNIVTEPQLYKQLIANPYSPSATQVISERFPEQDATMVIQAAVLAEPETAYERNFKVMNREQQAEELYRQIDTSAEMTVRLADYFNAHTDELWNVSADEIYDRLSEVAFGTKDMQQIEQYYSQKQRRGFRLSFVNFIEDMKNLVPYRDQFKDNPKGTAEDLFKIKEVNPQGLEGEVDVETLPIGFVIYVDENDYAKINRKQDIRQVRTAGITYSHIMLPHQINGRLIVIDKGGSTRGVKTPEELDSIRNHELKHVLFSRFNAEFPPLYPAITLGNIDRQHSFADHQRYAGYIKHSLSQEARDEVIAYHYGSGRNDPLSLEAIGGEKWLDHLPIISDHLWLQKDITPEGKKHLYDIYQREFREYMVEAREFQWIARKLSQAADNHEQTGLTKEKAEALLRNTPMDKARRLGVYFGIKPEGIPDAFATDQKELLKNLSKNPDIETLYQVSMTYPPEALPSLLELLNQSDDQVFMYYSLQAVEHILLLDHQRMSPEQLQLIQDSLSSFIEQRTDDAFKVAKNKALILQDVVKRQASHGLSDFVHNKPFSVTVVETLDTPHITQVNQIRKLLNSFEQALVRPGGVQRLIQAGQSSNPLEAWIIVKALRENIQAITPEAKPDLQTMLSHIATEEYKAAEAIVNGLRAEATKLQEELQ
jgi:hypothetical protein